MSSVCSLWEIQELEYFSSLRGTSQLLYFDTDSRGNFIFQDMDHIVCDVDVKKLETGVDRMQYYSALQRVESQIGEKCSR